MERKKIFSAKLLAGTGVLLALVIVLQTFSSVIPLAALLNFSLIPIVLGAILFGPLVGAVLGFACGVVVLIQVIMGGSPFYTAIWANDPIITLLTCLVKTTVAGGVSGFLYQWLKKKNELIAVFLSSGIVPILNTSLFILGCLFMTDSVYGMAGGQNVLVFILVGLVGFNFFFEFAFNLFFAPALHRIIGVAQKSFKRK